MVLIGLDQQGAAKHTAAMDSLQTLKDSVNDEVVSSVRMSWFQTVTRSNRCWFLVQIPAIDTTTMSTTLIGLLLMLPIRLTGMRFDLPGPKIVHVASPVDFKCSHDDKRQDIMLWYRQNKGRRPIELVGFSHVGNEPFYERNDTRLEISRADTQRGSLSIGSVRASDAEQNRDITLPTVTLLPPSRKECRSKDNEELQKTLVCVANGFFPDHVEMSWEVDRQTVKTGVATDFPALPDGAFYKMTSRLQVAADVWFTPGRTFTCRVSFFDGTDVTNRTKTLYGIEGEKWSRARYLKLAQSAKLSYAVLLVKGSVYAAFVGFLLWRRQGRTAKRSHS